MQAGQYGIDKVTFSWGGLNLMEAVAEGSEIVVNDVVPGKVTMKSTGNQGVGVIFVHHPSRAVMIDIEIDTEHPFYQVLKQVQINDAAGRNQVATGTLKDNSTGETEEFQFMRLLNNPRRRKGWDGSTQVFQFGGLSFFTPNFDGTNVIGEGVTPAEDLGQP